MGDSRRAPVLRVVGMGCSVSCAALAGADEQVSEDGVVLDEFEGEAAEVIARRSGVVAGCGDDGTRVDGTVLAARAWRDGVGDLAGVHGVEVVGVVGDEWVGRSEGGRSGNGCGGMDADHVSLSGEFPEFFLQEDGGGLGGVFAVEPADTQLLKKITDCLRHRQGDLHCVHIVL